MDRGGCAYFRVHMPMKYIEKYGFEKVETNIMDLENISWSADECKGGLAILQRQYGESNYKIAESMKKSGVKLIFELDDWLHGVEKKNKAYEVYKPGAPVHDRLYKFYELCDAITVSTKPLREKLLKYNKNIYVVPNSFILSDWKIDKVKHNTINILWTGSSTHYPDLAETEVANAIKAILNKYPNTKLITAGWHGDDIFRDIPGYRRIHYPWTVNINEISKFNRLGDIGIAPIKKCDFNLCKSSNKYVEYSLSGLPTIATKFGPYQEAINNMEDGLLVKNKFNNWYKAIEKLVLDSEMRDELSKKAKEKCIKKYDIEKNIINWVKVYNKILGLPENDGID